MEDEERFRIFYANLLRQAELEAAGGGQAPPTEAQARELFLALQTRPADVRAQMLAAEEEARREEEEIAALQEQIRLKRARRDSRLEFRAAVARELAVPKASELLGREGGLRASPAGALFRKFAPLEGTYPEDIERQNKLLSQLDAILAGPLEFNYKTGTDSRDKLVTLPRSVIELAVTRALAVPVEIHKLVCRKLDVEDFQKWFGSRTGRRENWDTLVGWPDIGEWTYEEFGAHTKQVLGEVGAQLATVPASQVQDVMRIHVLFTAWNNSRRDFPKEDAALVTQRFAFQMVVFLSGIPLTPREIEGFLMSLPGKQNATRAILKRPLARIGRGDSVALEIEGFWESDQIAPLLARLRERIDESEGRIMWAIAALLPWGAIPIPVARTFLCPGSFAAANFSGGGGNRRLPCQDTILLYVLEEYLTDFFPFGAKYFDAEFIADLVGDDEHALHVLEEFASSSTGNPRTWRRAEQVLAVLEARRVRGAGGGGAASGGGAAGR